MAHVLQARLYFMPAPATAVCIKSSEEAFIRFYSTAVVVGSRPRVLDPFGEMRFLEPLAVQLSQQQCRWV